MDLSTPKHVPRKSWHEVCQRLLRPCVLRLFEVQSVVVRVRHNRPLMRLGQALLALPLHNPISGNKRFKNLDM